jgi:signal peptidase I
MLYHHLFKMPMTQEKSELGVWRGWGLSLSLVMLLGVVGFLKAFVIAPIRISGASMWPTLADGQIRLVHRVAYRSRLPERGDIVLVSTGKELVVKRIVGLPGESISVMGGTVVIDQRPLAEPYLVTRGEWTIKPGTLNSNHYALLGDNRLLTVREQPFIVVDRQRILGQVIVASKSEGRGGNQ